MADDHQTPSVTKPTIPDRDFNIEDYGAVGDGETKNTEAFEKTIEAANEAGGGRVIVPEGTYLTGAIHLESNIDLHVQESATIKFSQDPDDYLPVVKTRFEGTELYNYSPLVYAYGKENIAITGAGTLDGNADENHWWPWKGKKEAGWEEGQPEQSNDADQLMKMGEDNVPVKEREFGKGHYLRPNMIQFYESENILIDGVTINDSPMWHIHPVLSKNITVQNTTIEGHGPNGDGVNPESSKNVLIQNNEFNNGDDNIAIKSGKNADGRRINVPSENIFILNNHMKDGHGAVTVGSEMSGGVKNVHAQNNVMDSPNLWNVLRIKTNTDRGGYAKNINFTNNIVENVRDEVFKINTNYTNDGEETTSEEHVPEIADIKVKNLESDGGEYALKLEGLDQAPIQGVRIIDSNFNNVQKDADIKMLKDWN
ncbi:glycoside hydrolase family 28 protein [Virgibacillus sp. NKC19-3]|nr:glycoside hydrolase family 28 protein [Virgibacillus sp. NKC19-3]